MSEIEHISEDKQAYRILLDSGIISDEKCTKCAYSPILDWFNYCPMCEHPTKRE
jgi:hypothetical protein